jgi:hypothetical protein
VNSGESAENEEAGTDSNRWFEDDSESFPEESFRDYEIIASPNDFNITTITNFVGSGAVKIPGFQRNYVWDLKRASRLIESILIGLPIPQIFLYEEGKNSFLVIDGQQRLMSIFYFVKGRFPRPDKRAALRRLMDEKSVLPPEVLGDDQYFTKFNLSLASKSKGSAPVSQYHGKNYETLADAKMQFDLRTIRNVVIKQAAPKEDHDSSVFEIFNRLNTGGVNLRQQEIRSSLYHSGFLRMLRRINLNTTWRTLTGLAEPDLHDKDIEILIRAFALVVNGDKYAEPMSGFLNGFSRNCMKLPDGEVEYAEALFRAFFDGVSKLSAANLAVAKSGRFNIAVFEAVFRASCTQAFKEHTTKVAPVNETRLEALKDDPEFKGATQQGIGRKSFVDKRFERAVAILNA